MQFLWISFAQRNWLNVPQECPYVAYIYPLDEVLGIVLFFYISSDINAETNIFIGVEINIYPSISSTQCILVHIPSCYRPVIDLTQSASPNNTGTIKNALIAFYSLTVAQNSSSVTFVFIYYHYSYFLTITVPDSEPG